MPLYEYRCRACGASFDLLTSWSRADDQACPECGAKADRQVSAFASNLTCEVAGGG